MPVRRFGWGSKAILAWNIGIFCFLASATVFVLGSFAAENAMRPPRLPLALVRPCFSHMHCESVAITARDGVTLKAWYYTPDKLPSPWEGGRGSGQETGSGAERAGSGSGERGSWGGWREKGLGRAILLLHGVGSNRQDMVALGNMFLRHGFSVL